MTSVVVLGGSIVALAPCAAAATPTLEPPPPSETSCKTTGSGTTCTARLKTTFEFPAEFTCGGQSSFDINEKGSTDREVVFTYNRDGNLVKRITRILSLTGTFTNATSGKSAPESGHFTITHEFSTPGDESTDKTTINGVFAKVTLPGSGIVLQDTGHTVYAPNGDVLKEGGKHDFDQGDVTNLCQALA